MPPADHGCSSSKLEKIRGVRADRASTAEILAEVVFLRLILV